MPPSELWLQGLSLFGATFLDEQCPFVSFPREFFMALLISCLNFFIQLRMSIMKICLHRKATISDSLHASTSATSYKALTASTKVSVGSLIVLCLAQRRKSHCLLQTLLSMEVGLDICMRERSICCPVFLQSSGLIILSTPVSLLTFLTSSPLMCTVLLGQLPPDAR